MAQWIAATATSKPPQVWDIFDSLEAMKPQDVKERLQSESESWQSMKAKMGLLTGLNPGSVKKVK